MKKNQKFKEKIPLPLDRKWSTNLNVSAVELYK